MKKIIFLVINILLINISLSQIVKETEFYKFQDETPNIYNLIYDEGTKTYVYIVYDEDSQKSYIISNKGNSRRYDFLSPYNILFDRKGNYYVTANNYLKEEERSEYFLLINGEEKGKYNFIQYPMSMYDEILYFVAEKDSMYYLVSYDTKKNKFEYGKMYNYIYLTKIDEKYKWEPAYELGFTKNGKPYYIAEEGNYTFLVIGNEEQKKYSGIRNYFTIEDIKGNICYNAIVNEGENQYGFFVQGNKEYKRFKATLNPVVFKSDNTPVYIGSDNEFNEYYSQFVIEGDQPGKVYNSYIYDLNITPNGKIAYIATDSTDDGKYYSRVVIDGKEHKKYNNVSNLKFLSDDTPVYIGGVDEEQFLVIGNKEIKYNYEYIFNIFVTPNDKISYIGVIYGKEEGEKEKYYIHIGDKKLGPYSDLPYYYMEDVESFVKFNMKGNYAFISSIDEEKYTIVSDYFKCGNYSIIYLLNSYRNDFYFIGGKEISEGKNSYCIYKNGQKIGDSYDDISNYNFDKEKGIITFFGLRENTAFYVRVSL